MNDMEQLFVLCNDMLECIRYCYPHNHPIIARHLFLIAVVLLKREREGQRAIVFLNESQHIFDYIFGVDHQRSIANRQLLESINE